MESLRCTLALPRAVYRGSSRPASSSRTPHRSHSAAKSGTEIRLDGEELVILKESDVMGVVETQATLSRAA